MYVGSELYDARGRVVEDVPSGRAAVSVVQSVCAHRRQSTSSSAHVLLLSPALRQHSQPSHVRRWTAGTSPSTLRRAAGSFRSPVYFVISSSTTTSGPTQPPTLSGMGNEYQPESDELCGSGVKAGIAHFTRG